MSDSGKLRLLKNRIQSSRPPLIQQRGGSSNLSSDRKVVVVETDSLVPCDDILGITIEGGEEVEDHVQPVMASPMKPLMKAIKTSNSSTTLTEVVEPVALSQRSSSRGHDSDIEEEIEVIENPPTPLCQPIGSGTGSGSHNNVQWLCHACNNECLVITRESRCLCGHRRKEHLNSATSQGKGKGQLPCQDPGYYDVNASINISIIHQINHHILVRNVKDVKVLIAHGYVTAVIVGENTFNGYNFKMKSKTTKLTTAAVVAIPAEQTLPSDVMDSIIGN
eukprot:scaffold6421_cov251-Ochromonas_danica.AAC.11